MADIKITGFKVGTAAIGDTWDMLALDYYDEEMLAPLLLRYNPSLDSIVVFEDNMEIVVPIIDESTAASLPVWRQA